MNYFVFLPFIVDEPVVSKCLKYINIPKDRLLLIDNSIDSFGEKYEKQGYNVVYSPENLGCAGGWNVGLKAGLEFGADMIIMLNSVEYFTKGFKEEVIDKLHLANEYGFTTKVPYHCRGITPKLIKEVGFFDENFYPVYCEDCDYLKRINLKGLYIPNININFLREEKRSSVDYGIVWDLSKPHAYYNMKWGGGFKVVDGKTTNKYLGDESYKTPFNKNLPLWYWSSKTLEYVKLDNGNRYTGFSNEWIERFLELPEYKTLRIIRDRYWNSNGATVKKILIGSAGSEKRHYMHTWLSRITYERVKKISMIINEGSNVDIKYYDDCHTIITEELTVLQTWTDDIARIKGEKYYMGWLILEKLKYVYSKGLILNDLSTHNILIKEGKPFFIDLDDSEIDIGERVQFEHSVMIKGNEKGKGGFESECNRGLKKELGFSYNDYDLIRKLINKGLPTYGTYHWEDFTYLDSKRNTLDRIKSADLINVEGKKILDLGSNYGSMGLELLKRGASEVHFVELDEDKLLFVEELLKRLKVENYKTSLFNVDELDEQVFKGYDIITCFSLTGWVKNPKKLVNNLNNSGCPVIIVEPNYGNHKEIVKLELSNYYTEIIGKDVSGREYYKYEIRTAD